MEKLPGRVKVNSRGRFIPEREVSHYGVGISKKQSPSENKDSILPIDVHRQLIACETTIVADAQNYIQQPHPDIVANKHGITRRGLAWNSQ